MLPGRTRSKLCHLVGGRHMCYDLETTPSFVVSISASCHTYVQTCTCNDVVFLQLQQGMY